MRDFKIKYSFTDKTLIHAFLKDIARIPLITQKDEVALVDRIKQGDIEARNDLIKANLRFVVSIAKQYQNHGLEIDDLIEDGVLGLIHAADVYDASRGFKFISFAVWWIRQSIIKSLLDTNSAVRIPINQINNITAVNNERERFYTRYEREPTVEELIENTKLTRKKVMSALRIGHNIVSIGENVTDIQLLEDVLINENARDADEHIEKNTTQDRIEKILLSLPKPRGEIIMKYFGIDNYQLTFEELMREYGMCYEKIKQYFDEGMHILKSKYKVEMGELLKDI